MNADIASAIHLIAYLLKIVQAGGKMRQEDLDELRDLAERIKISPTTSS